VGFLLHDVARLMRKRFEQHARDLGLTRSQWQVLAYLDKNEGIRQGALAELLEIEPITLGRILDKLEACGMVERRPHPTDRRVWQLHLTPKASPMLGKMREMGDRTRREALAGVPKAEQDMLVRLLGTMKANLAQACD
jgi:DNA-binding MarR family transcriptional regulator